jgi:predicted  nucleic acid-binding Zn-ribbon protein
VPNVWVAKRIGEGSMDKDDELYGLGDLNQYCQQIKVPTEDELTALNAMRTIKDRVRKLKRRLSEVANSDVDKEADETRELKKEIAQLKTDWREWEEKRKIAARVRMILLGHEER